MDRITSQNIYFPCNWHIWSIDMEQWHTHTRTNEMNETKTENQQWKQPEESGCQIEKTKTDPRIQKQKNKKQKNMYRFCGGSFRFLDIFFWLLSFVINVFSHCVIVVWYVSAVSGVCVNRIWNRISVSNQNVKPKIW